MGKFPKIGLALGGGGAKGLAHIGVIKVLLENKIPIDFIAGSSMGALVGSWYSLTGDIKGMKNLVFKLSRQKILSLFLDPSIRQGLIKGEKIKSFLESYLGRKNFDDCKIPFCSVATDFETGETVFIDKGSVIDAVRASISLPLVFAPVRIGGKLLVDAGLSMPVPVSVVKKMGADFVIAVNVNARYRDIGKKKKYGFGMYGIALKSIDIMYYRLSLCSLRGADVVINPGMAAVRWSHFTKGKSIISYGEKVAAEFVPEIKEKISKLAEIEKFNL